MPAPGAGKESTRERFNAAMESICNLDFGAYQGPLFTGQPQRLTVR